MKLIHLSDLHLGKRVNEFSMIKDQKYILDQILKIADDESPDVICIAGDIYDKSVPSEEAVELFDDFIYHLSKMDAKTLIISGNHDSAERLSFASRLIKKSDIYISPVYTGHIKPVVAEDEYGKVNFYMLPFIKPANVRRYFPDDEINTYTDAMRICIDDMSVNESERNVLITHQFVTGAMRSESETISVGTLDNVDAEVFDVFDYVALGHIHGPQRIKRDTLRYCGTPLKYSFSEKDHQKSVTVANIEKKGSGISIRTVPLIPLHDMRQIRGTYDELTARDYYKDIKTDDYLYITLTDEDDVPHAMARLRVIYPNLMKLDYDNARTANSASLGHIKEIKSKSPMEIFGDFFEKQNGQKMTKEQKRYVKDILMKGQSDKTA